jgi:archaellum biogenesis ATPase FlaH
MLTRQIMNGVIKQGLSVNLFTTGHTTRNFIRHVGSIILAVSHYFATASLKEVPHDIIGFTWNKEAMVNISWRLSATTILITAQSAII